MFDGLKLLYSDKNTFQRQIVLFSICGIIGLFNTVISFDKMGLAEVTMVQKCLFQMLWVLYAFFLTGFETLFLHERFMPDIDRRSFKLVISKTLMFVFLMSIPLGFVALFLPQFTAVAFFVEICLSVPLTMLQAGYSYEFNDNDAFKLFQKFGMKEYFVLVFKRLWIIILSYLISYFIVFIIFFVFGFVMALMYRSDISTLGMIISSNQVIIAKMSNLIAGVSIMYLLTVGTLVWDYELIKTYERKD